MAIGLSELIARLRTLAPFEDDAAAQRALDATLKALRRGLADDEADWLALDLGPEIAAPLVDGQFAGDLSLEQFYRQMGRRAGLRRSAAREQAQVVCRALGELLSASTVARLQRCIPKLAPAFLRPDPGQPASGPHHLREEPGPDHTLAGGRSGSDRPLCDSRPANASRLPVDSPARGHTHSVAVSDDPHGASKLSGAHGLSQEREQRSLATWRRGAERR